MQEGRLGFLKSTNEKFQVFPALRLPAIPLRFISVIIRQKGGCNQVFKGILKFIGMTNFNDAPGNSRRSEKNILLPKTVPMITLRARKYFNASVYEEQIYCCTRFLV